MKKLEKIYGDVRRELDFTTWFNRSIDKPILGPLDRIDVFPEEVANIPALTTYRNFMYQGI